MIPAEPTTFEESKTRDHLYALLLIQLQGVDPEDSQRRSPKVGYSTSVSDSRMQPGALAASRMRIGMINEFRYKQKGQVR